MTTYDHIAAPAEWLCAHCGRPRAAHHCLQGFARERHQFVAMLRVRNEERWISDVLESIRPLCTRIFLMDDHSVDRTVEFAQRFEPLVTILPSPFMGLNESRDKNWLYDQIMVRCEPEWILCIDGDEVLEKRGPEIIREVIANNAPRERYLSSTDEDLIRVIAAEQSRKQEVTGYSRDICDQIIASHENELRRRRVGGESGRQAYSLQIAYLWDSRNTVRVDRIYGDFWRPSLFRPFIPDPDKPDDLKIAGEFRFKSTPFGRHINSDQPNLHCSSVPQRRIHGRGLMPVRLKHYGYMWRDDRVRKLDYMTAIDWKNESEGWYRHICQGDSPTIEELPRVRALVDQGVLTEADVETLLDAPEDARLLHAGPRVIVPWDENEVWPISDWAKGQHP